MVSFTIVGNVDITIKRIPNISGLQCINGDNWGPQVISNVNFNRATYCYLTKASKAILDDIANEYDAYYINEPVRREHYKIANIVYHREEDFIRLHHTINCLLVLKTVEDENYILLCYFPAKVLNQKKDKKDKKDEKEDENNNVTELLEKLKV